MKTTTIIFEENTAFIIDYGPCPNPAYTTCLHL
jgi:hypothetical protein